MYHRILVPTDGSDTAERGLAEAIALAQGTDATLVLLHVVRETTLVMDGMSMAYYNDVIDLLLKAGSEMVDKAARRVAEAGLACETTVVDAHAGAAWETIVDEAAKSRCDLIVMGTHGRRGLKRLTLGSDAELVVRHAPVPVMLVNSSAAGERSPAGA
jgi:nucleotide-binding universal stress UspA family protein